MDRRDLQICRNLETGRRLYEEKDYLGAIKAFTEAIHFNSSEMLVTALRERIRVHVKLDQLKLALADAKQLLKLTPTAANAYLLAGEICVKLGKALAALQIYERGLKRVNAGTHEHRLRMQAHANALRRGLGLGPGETTDPLDRAILPVELSLMVIRSLDMRGLMTCLRVCKAWKAFLEQEPNLWTTLDMSKSRKAVSRTSLRAFLKRSKLTLENATMKMFPDQCDTIYTVLGSCKKLQYLAVGANYSGTMIGTSLISNLPMAKNLKTLVLNHTCIINGETMRKVLAACPSLSHVEFQNVQLGQLGPASQWQVELPCLTHLRLKHRRSGRPRDWSPWEDLKLEQLIPLTPNVIEARFEFFDCHGLATDPVMPDFAQWKKLEVLSFHKTSVGRLPRLPQSIISLDITDNDCQFHFKDFMHHGDGENGLEHPERHVYPNIEEFHTNNSNSVKSDLLEFLLRASIAAGKLRILAIGGREERPSSYPPCRSLQYLDLSGTSDWDEDDILEMAVTMYPNLTELNLSQTRITGYGLKQITQRTKGPLEKLILRECMYISQDAYDYLESVRTVVVR